MQPIPCERSVGRWDQYLRLASKKNSSALAIEALPHALLKCHVLDLGAGAMNDSKFFLDSGFQNVTAVDASTASIAYASDLRAIYPQRFSFHHSRFYCSEVPFGCLAISYKLP